MSLPFGLLGLLRYSDSTGYDLAKQFRESLSTLWRAQHSQIHRELNSMEEKGWIVSHVVIQEGKPNKRVFSITDKGEEAFLSMFLESGNLYQNYSSPLLLKVLFGAADPKELLRTLKVHLDGYTSGLQRQIQVREEIEKKKNVVTLKDAEIESFYWHLVLDGGIAQTEYMIKWLQSSIEKIEKELGE